MNGFVTALRKYAKFSGRSRRREFWGFALVYWGLHLLLSTLLVLAMQGTREGYMPPTATVVAITWIVVAAALFLPWLAVSWRRYQDIGWPGAASLLGLPFPLITAIVGFMPGIAGDNPYGPDPKALG